ncbi:twin-arginine translocase subunit TatC [Thauera sp. CAU 1555]|jgi:sec-independent protein translocase protein TatC|uniref:Sec-independent protein translocase protein TatC n=1 Tax=Thauera sedimentorum TaxID=2767595 RepID=A0ABR9BDS1_9RHOO|nr:twin-arginine translocase subunit TatC [Thauera sedimentorum]MBC9073585.1 twin-arginine translocase subunit TatC [Thauera sedimentorum]MBD8504504.1 twin-arginine translocase subunit TatC [Thauera sedimentorum]
MSTATQETFISHLVELRDRLLRAVVAVIVVFVCLMPWAGDIYDLLALPMMNTLPEGTNMIATGVVTPFFVPVKVTLMVSFVIALPIVLYQAWSFIAPGLYAHERRMAIPLVLGTTLLFLIGMAFCYFFVFGMVFSFIAEFAPKSIVPAPDIEQYLSFVMTLFLAFGLTFEVPVVVVVLARAGIVSIEKLREARPYVIVGAFVIAAIVTPPDVISQLLLAIPMCLLYEFGIMLAKMVRKPAVPAVYEPPSEDEMDRELDRIEASERSDGK